VELLGLCESVVPEDLHVAEHGLDCLLLPGQLTLYLLTVVLGIFRMDVVNSLGLKIANFVIIKSHRKTIGRKKYGTAQ
jgi:hypothetical protein